MKKIRQSFNMNMTIPEELNQQEDIVADRVGHLDESRFFENMIAEIPSQPAAANAFRKEHSLESFRTEPE